MTVLRLEGTDAADVRRYTLDQNIMNLRHGEVPYDFGPKWWIREGCLHFIAGGVKRWIPLGLIAMIEETVGGNVNVVLR